MTPSKFQAGLLSGFFLSGFLRGKTQSCFLARYAGLPVGAAFSMRGREHNKKAPDGEIVRGFKRFMFAA
ncbi:hypothetical protein P8H26_08840 [Pseudochrobactrum sp. sp1633]|uniref:hypothetical protein n=1 Tax=Pseudochrobactrum sp. sp1633 TaxID=3036706 RepID=UPI0025A678DA|nr:hypothetical protein [Pseudochrobactrum sp. sp1633]MDM8345499.1 hypothetical protein [Pseudochrobactrum sp. sp1633]